MASPKQTRPACSRPFTAGAFAPWSLHLESPFSLPSLLYPPPPLTPTHPFSHRYSPLQIVAGYLSQALGGKYVALVVLLGSACEQALLPWAVAAAPSQALPRMMMVMLGVGIAQSGLVPSKNVLNSEWFPPGPQRGTVMAVLKVGNSVGKILATAVLPYVATHYGWQSSAYLVAGLAAFMSLAWTVLAASTPASCWWLGLGRSSAATTGDGRKAAAGAAAGLAQKAASAKDALPAAKPSAAAGEPEFSMGGFVRLMTYRSAWAIVLAHLIHNCATYTMDLFGLRIYTHRFGMSVQEAGLYMSVTETCALLSNFAAAGLGAMMYRAGYSNLGVRRISTLGGFAGGALGMLIIGLAPQPWMLCAGHVLYISAMSINVSGYLASYLDMRPFVGPLSGLGNTFANMSAGVGMPWATTAIFHRFDSVAPLCCSVAVLMLAAAANFAYAVRTTLPKELAGVPADMGQAAADPDPDKNSKKRQ